MNEEKIPLSSTGPAATRRPCARFLFALLCLLAFADAPAGAQNTPADVIRQVGFDQKLDAQVPLELGFRDATGQPVALQNYFGKKPVVLALVYYDCPMLCTMVLNGLVRSLRAVKLDAGDQFQVVVVSFDPGETPALAAAKKDAYVHQYGRAGAAEGWHFLTGEQVSIRRLTQAVGFRYTYDARSRQFAHASGIVVLTPSGKVSRYFYGIEYAARDLRLGLVEASANKIGTTIDQVLLFCYHYDPLTGKYGFVIMNFIRLAGLATVLALGGFIFLMLRRERRGLLGTQPERT